jgi:hypothetical protein
MPEAAVDENRHAGRAEHDVGFAPEARQRCLVQAVTKPQSMQCAGQVPVRCPRVAGCSCGGELRRSRRTVRAKVRALGAASAVAASVPGSANLLSGTIGKALHYHDGDVVRSRASLVLSHRQFDTLRHPRGRPTGAARQCSH